MNKKICLAATKWTVRISRYYISKVNITSIIAGEIYALMFSLILFIGNFSQIGRFSTDFLAKDKFSKRFSKD